VPLFRQAIAILLELQLLTGHGGYVFSSERTQFGIRANKRLRYK
jgi:hypothetical protein